ncbi:uncharacterized protein LOC116573641 isoform X4 [Mustela erminea]|nr:uncharacterized protein LOC116573641 isoform X3 [Mustela erminea]XP_032169733.1 uncharacterized protein LOC116573641 isoform X4 [Mustela erminea]
MTLNWSVSPATNILSPPPHPRLVSENQARGPKPCPPGEPGARRSDPIVRSSDPRAGSTARARSSNSALGSRLYVFTVLGSFFLPRQEMAPIFSSHGGLRPRRLWGSLIGVLFSLYFPGLRIALPAAALPPPSAGPGSRTSWARSSPLPARRVTMAPSRPRPHPAALHFQSHLPGEVGFCGETGRRVRGLPGCGSWVLGTGPRGDRAGTEQGQSKPNMACARRAGVVHSGLRCADPARRRPRPGRAARGFHGDGKLASTASATTAKFPAFHPPLGAQRDDRGAGCEERERGDSDPEWHFHGSWQVRILPLNHQCFHGS